MHGYISNKIFYTEKGDDRAMNRLKFMISNLHQKFSDIFRHFLAFI
jgi:hypothetical protein